MAAAKKDYYEVLGVNRDAGDEEIKKSFKKLAMGLTGHMTAKTGKNVSLADVIEKAVYALAKAEGYRVMGEE